MFARRLTPFFTALVLVSLTASGVDAASPRSAYEFSYVVSRADLVKAGQLIDFSSPHAGPTTRAGCLWDCDHVRNVTYVGQNKPFVTLVKGNGPQTLGMNVTLTTQNGYTATIGISAGAVTAGVGFNVNWSGSVSYTTSTVVPSGSCYTIRAYNIFNDYTYEIWREPFFGPDYRVGTGRAWKFMGVQYTVTKSC